MRDNFEREFQSAHDAFVRCWGEISEGLQLEGDLLAVEGVGDETSNALDIHGGIDYWVKRRGAGVCALSVRCQFGDPWRSATWRTRRLNGAKTEEQKRIEAAGAEKRGSNPIYHVQAYFTSREDPELLYAVRMLIDEMIEASVPEYRNVLWYRGKNLQDGSGFKIFDSAAMKKHGFEVLELLHQAKNTRITPQEAPQEAPWPF